MTMHLAPAPRPRLLDALRIRFSFAAAFLMTGLWVASAVIGWAAGMLAYLVLTNFATVVACATAVVVALIVSGHL